MPKDIQEARIVAFGEGQDMQQKLWETIPQDLLRPPALVAPHWMVASLQLEVLVAMRACLDSGSSLFFEV